MIDFYTYLHCKPNGDPFYVGKGSGNRAKKLIEAKGRIDFVMLLVLMVGFGFALFLIFSLAQAGPLDETRYCGPPVRNTDGSVHRSAAILKAFQRIHPCPSTRLTTGKCPGWVMNHDRSLACGGATR